MTNLEKLKELVKIQCTDGTWDYDPYMQGMANGLLLALHIMDNDSKSPEFLDAPEYWGKDSRSPKPTVVATTRERK